MASGSSLTAQSQIPGSSATFPIQTYSPLFPASCWLHSLSGRAGRIKNSFSTSTLSLASFEHFSYPLSSGLTPWPIPCYEYIYRKPRGCPLCLLPITAHLDFGPLIFLCMFMLKLFSIVQPTLQCLYAAFEFQVIKVPVI